MKNILVAVDFSKASRNASEYAVALARVFKANIVLINAIAPPVIIDDVAAAPLIISQSEMVKTYEQLMNGEIEALTKKYEIKISGFVQEGYPTNIIDNLAKDIHTDMIVMGMKGKGSSNAIFGSTTTAMMRKTSVPVLVIPENAIYKSIAVITFATDFDPETELKGYPLLEELIEKYNSFIQILNVQKNELVMTPGDVIGKMKTNHAFSAYAHVFQTIGNKDVVEGINKFIKENPTDVLVMVAHRHSFLERMFGKIYTRLMSHQTKIPLLILEDK